MIPCLPVLAVSRRRAVLVVCVFASLVLGPSRRAEAAVFTVGGAGCTHPDLTAALVAAVNSPGFDEIHLLAGSTHQGQFLLNSGGLALRGGFASCAAAEPTGFSTLRGDNSSRALFLNSFGAVSLEKLSITGGSVTGNGGGLLIQGNGTVSLLDVLVFGNSATGKGGDIYIDASTGLQVFFLAGSVISAGSALDGGGLACTGPGTVWLRDDTVVVNNIAESFGGGVYITAGCSVNHQAGGALGGISLNTAGEEGGGVFIDAGSELNTGLDSDGLAVISENSSNNGGGVAVGGDGAVLRAFYARIEGNHAQFLGGGIFAYSAAVVAVGRPFTGNDPCPFRDRCSLVRSNSAGSGGAFFVVSAARLTVHGTHVEFNSADSSPVAAALLAGEVTIHSSIIVGNVGPDPFSVDNGGARLTLGNVTVMSNTGVGAGLIKINAGSGFVQVASSIFQQQEGALFGFVAAGSSVEVDCVLSSTTEIFSVFPAGATVRGLLVADAKLANPAAGNYQLRGDSPAIDFCDTTHWNGGEIDIDGQPRDIELPVTNFLGSRDVGADEYRDVFSDGFESGTTASWDAAVN